MSLLRLSSCRLSLVARSRPSRFQPATSLGSHATNGKLHTQILDLRHPYSLRHSQLLDDETGSVGLQYSTSAKPHMTKSLLKWKKRKRKSKAQQQKEMENLQRDLVKLLTKRAIQVVRNKSLLNAHREVVTCHAFDHQNLHDYQNSHGLVGGSLTPMDLTEKMWNRRAFKSYHVAQAVEAQLSVDGRIDPSHVTPTGTESAALPGACPTFDHKNSLGRYKGEDSSVLSVTCSSQKQPSLIDYKPITYSELFHTSINKQSGYSSQNDLDFLSAFKSFSSELSVTENVKVPNFKQDWDSEAYLQDNYSEKSSLSPIFSQNSSNFAQDALSPVQLKIESSLTKEKDVQRDLHEKSIYLRQDSFSSKDIAPENISKMSPLSNSRTNMPNIFIHDPIDSLDDTIHDNQEIGQSPWNVKRTKSATSKKKPAKHKVVSSKGTDPDSATTSRDVLSPEDNPDNFSISQEMREMLDRSFVEACCFTGCELLAVRNLQYHATKSKLSSVHVFNVLIHALAKKGDLQTIKLLFLLLRQQGLEPTLQTYAACLECMGRMSEVDIELCRNLIADVKKSNLDLADIARKCFFKLDEWDYVMKAIRLAEPDFTPHPMKFHTTFDNKLLLGLNTVNNEAAEYNQYAVDFSHQEMMERAKMQLDMEVKGEVKVKSIAADDLRETLRPKTRDLRNDLLMEWRKVLVDSFEQKVAMLEKNAQDNINMTLYPFLKLFPKEEYVNIIFKCLKDLLTMSSGYSPTLLMIKNDLGWAVNRKFNTALRLAGGMDKKVMAVYEHFMEDFLDKDKRLDSHRLLWRRAMSRDFNTMNMDMSLRRWPGHITREIGKFLLDMILYDLKVNANTFKKRAPKRQVPAFCTMVMSVKSRYTTAELKLHPVVSRLFAVDDSEYFSFTPCVVPMLVPPVPWISRNTGSLLLGSSALVRMRPSSGHVDPLKSVRESRYSAVLDSLNTLSACAWKINRPVLDLQIEVFNNKGDSKLKVAPPASQFPPLPVVKKDLTAKEKALLYKERQVLQQQCQDAHGLWCTDLYRLSIANKFRDETFWFPHSMDFRGRTYPLPPHFNHLGSDNVRGMLLFAKGKPLGEKGYDWLKIHLINLTGLRKRSSNDERLEYADSVMKDILDSADSPLTGKKWWQSSDEPWQTLACCMEIAKIERFEGNKADYVCHFPVHQDGSCNGLQHYAAIGRDQAGAESVNLHPFDVPKDVYSDVVDLVEKARQAHAEEGKEIAQVLEGFIKRKVIKQTIMTTVYGVTRYGAREQIHRQLKDIPDFPSEESWRGSMYLTQTTFSCLREMFTAAKDIQDWLTEASCLISAFMPVDWVTPLGFPVMQPYFKRVGKHSQGFDRLYLAEEKVGLKSWNILGQEKTGKQIFKPNTMKQKNAFPPNYIHSLDSTHMMLTALYCVHAGITFVSVHDCYWTHACDVPVMNRICREQFVSMHKQPLLEDLSEHLIALVNRASRDPNLVEAMKKVNIPALLQVLEKVPKRGSFDLDNVLKSTYFFS